MAILGVADNNNIKSLFANYDPAFSNLFSVKLYEGEYIKPDVIRDEDSITRYSMLHATSISFAGPGITLKRHDVTKLFTLEKYQRSDVVSITWREDKNFSVRNFHKKWLQKFYNEKEDVYISYPSKEEARANLMKSIKVDLREGVDTITLHLTGVMPQKIPDLDLSWESPGIITYTLSYYVTDWSWG